MKPTLENVIDGGIHEGAEVVGSSPVEPAMHATASAVKTIPVIGEDTGAGPTGGSVRPPPTITRTSLDKIACYGGTQIRANKFNAEIVEDYKERMVEGVEFPAVIIFDDGHYKHLADGFHRVEAAKRAGLTAIDAEIRTGALVTVEDEAVIIVGASPEIMNAIALAFPPPGIEPDMFADGDRTQG
jgi:hypothetical protein